MSRDGLLQALLHNIAAMFPVPLPAGIEARSPDDFLCSLLELDPENMVALLRAQAAALRSPPVPLEKLLAGLAKTVPGFVQALATYME